ncbi:MAG: BadF/BadG/BcrA/BcrD ATPase family protein [Gemmatimonadota bacterium]
MANEVVIGIDGGGTRTRVLIMDRSGKEIGIGEGSATLVDPEAPAKAALLVDTIVRRVLNEHRVPRPAAALWAALAGAGRESTRQLLKKELEEISRDLVRRVEVGTDVDAAIHDAFGKGPGIVLISGTGSIAYAVTAEGERLSVGGWGSTLGDEGSGYALGLAGLSALLRAHDGRGPRTELSSLLKELGLAAPAELVDWVAHATKRDIAALAPTVVGIADRGDAVAQSLVNEAVAELRLHLKALLERLGPQASIRTVALVGGLIVPGRALRSRVERVINEMGLEILTREVRPDRGAARFALELAEPVR